MTDGDAHYSGPLRGLVSKPGIETNRFDHLGGIPERRLTWAATVPCELAGLGEVKAAGRLTLTGG